MPKEILEMIEKVSPDDSAALDEIDARVWLLLNKERQAPHPEFWDEYEEKNIQFVREHSLAHPYTRSRDALKAIRPEGCNIFVYQKILRVVKRDAEGGSDEVYGFDIRMMKNWRESEGKGATEELAELHAILQALEYERNAK